MVLDTSSLSTFTAITRLYSDILNSIETHNNLYEDIADTIIFEDDKSNLDEKIKEISITYYIK